MVPPRVQLCEGTGVGWLLPHPWGQGHSQRGQEPCVLSQRCDCPQAAAAVWPRQELGHQPGWLPAERGQQRPQTPSRLPNSGSPAALGFKKGGPRVAVPPATLSPEDWQRHGGSCPHGTGQGGDRDSCQLGPSRGHRPCDRSLACSRTPGRGFVSPPCPSVSSPAQCVCSAEEFWEFRQSQTFLQAYNEP